MILFKHRRSAERDAFSVPRSVQKSIPIKRIYQDGVFQVSGKFSKTWRFFDVNYAVASPEKQRELFMTYCSFLNSLPIGATAKITLFNRQLNQKDFGRTLLMPMQGDRRDLYRNEYNALVLGKAAESNNLIQEKYITVSAEKKSVEEARAFFSRVGTDLTTGLSRMSSSVREITVNDRLRLLHDFYRPGEEQLFRFNLEDTMRRGHDFRDCIAPDCISFQKNHYELGDHVGRTLFLREYASFISDAMITELMDYPRNMMLSIDIIPVAMDEAVSDIRKRIMSVESDITRWQQRQNQSNNFTANIPYDLEQMRSETKEFMDDLMSRDQRMMLALVTLTHLADNLEQLDQDTEALQAIGRARGCQFNILRYQQEDALNTVLPLGLKRIDATRTLTTECTAVLMPFKSQEIQDAGGIYYGVNAVSHNLIICNRGNLLNGNGFITGVSGSGKSMAAKQEVSALALSTDHDIIIVDPEREYGELVRALGGEVITISASDPNGCHINALDLSEGYGDGKEPLVMKSEFIMSLYEQLMGADKIEPQEKSIIVMNPPYGERISTNDLLGLYQMIGERLKHAFVGNEAWVLSYREECFDQIGLKPSKKVPLFNGALECEFRKYEIFDGKYKEFKSQEGEGEEKKETEGNYDTSRPRERKEFKPRGEGEFKPRREGEFKPRREGEFKPRREGEYKPRREGEFKPRKEGDFKPRREEGSFTRDDRDKKPRGEFRGERDSRAPREFRGNREPRIPKKEEE